MSRNFAWGWFLIFALFSGCDGDIPLYRNTYKEFSVELLPDSTSCPSDGVYGFAVNDSTVVFVEGTGELYTRPLPQIIYVLEGTCKFRVRCPLTDARWELIAAIHSDTSFVVSCPECD